MCYVYNKWDFVQFFLYVEFNFCYDSFENISYFLQIRIIRVYVYIRKDTKIYK